MGSPRVDQINVVVDDPGSAAAFLAQLGVDVPDALPAWGDHHLTIPSSASPHGGHDLAEHTFGIDLDSNTFAAEWGGIPRGFNGVVLNLRVDGRAEVDRLHERAVSVGGRSLKGPYDAFWGSRFAVVEGPGPLLVGLMSVPDAARRSAPPDPATFA